MKLSYFFLILVLLVPGCSYPQQNNGFRSVKDLKPTWQMFKEGGLVDFDGSPQRVVHFSVDLRTTTRQVIRLASSHKIFLFLNSKYSNQSHQILLNCDSLRKSGLDKILISVFQESKITDLTTELVSKEAEDKLANTLRPSSAYSDFLIIASIILIIFFTSLVRTNPQLTFDYLNVTKLFYFIGQDETPNLLRITSSVNLLFYFFCSLMASLALITTAHHTTQVGWSNYFDSHTMPGYLQNWLVYSLVILGMLLAKLILEIVIARLFNWKDITGFQFFNFVRILLVSLMALAGLIVVAFSLGVAINYRTVLYGGCILLLTGSIIIFLKLLRRAPFNSFHLFFFLCSTEIFPLMVLVKVLLF